MDLKSVEAFATKAKTELERLDVLVSLNPTRPSLLPDLERPLTDVRPLVGAFLLQLSNAGQSLLH